MSFIRKNWIKLVGLISILVILIVAFYFVFIFDNRSETDISNLNIPNEMKSKLDQTILEKLAAVESNEKIMVNVLMTAEVDFSELKGLTAPERVEYMESFDKASQQSLLEDLDRLYPGEVEITKSWSVINGFECLATKEAILYMASRDDVFSITTFEGLGGEIE